MKKIIDDFCSRFTPGGTPVYLADNDKEWSHFDAEYLRRLGVAVEETGRMPNAVVHFAKENWLFLIEAASNHGPVTTRRLTELISLFAGCRSELVFVTAVLNRRGFLKYLGDVAWGTHVWIADAPDHMIHFNGDCVVAHY